MVAKRKKRVAKKLRVVAKVARTRVKMAKETRMAKMPRVARMVKVERMMAKEERIVDQKSFFHLSCESQKKFSVKNSATFFSEFQISEHQIFDRHFTKFQTNNIISNSQISKLSNFRSVNFLNCQIVKLSNCRTFNKISKLSNIQQNFEMTPPNWATLFSDNYPLRGIFRLG
jgi:hypothetical protein